MIKVVQLTEDVLSRYGAPLVCSSCAKHAKVHETVLVVHLNGVTVPFDLRRRVVHMSCIREAEQRMVDQSSEELIDDVIAGVRQMALETA